MAKAPADTIKYVIHGEVNIDGAVEKPDVVGAIFGQSEGMLGEELELRDLQKTGKLGRIEIEVKTTAGKSNGTLTIPSSLDMVETSVIASAVERVDRVGPCNAEIKITNIEDARHAGRKKIVKRAKELLKKLIDEQIPESREIVDEVREGVQIEEITSYRGLPAGPSIDDAESVIVVEGRADVLNLLKAGIKNVISVEGTNISQTIVDLTNKKDVIAFIDGDRGGEMILQELLQVAEIDFVARAPQGKEVEDLGKKEIIMALRRKIPSDQVNKKGDKSAEKTSEKANMDKRLFDELKKIKGSMNAKLLDRSLNQITEIEVKDLVDSLGGISPHCVVFDGVITQRLVDVASKSGVKYIVGRTKYATLNPRNVKVLTEK